MNVGCGVFRGLFGLAGDSPGALLADQVSSENLGRLLGDRVRVNAKGFDCFPARCRQLVYSAEPVERLHLCPTMQNDT